jgi:hypothetical protein
LDRLNSLAEEFGILKTNGESGVNTAGGASAEK